MGTWKNHMTSFYKIYNSDSKMFKAIWLAAAGFYILASGFLIFIASKNFVKQQVKIAIDTEKLNHIPYPPLKFCSMHWLTWVDWKRVEELQFSRLELWYTMSYITENVYSLDTFNSTEIEASVKNKLNSLNMTLKTFLESIVEAKPVTFYPDMHVYSIDLTAISIPYYKDIFDVHHLMCYTFVEQQMQSVLNEGKNSSAEMLDIPYGFEVDVHFPFLDDHETFLYDDEYEMLIQDFVKDWKMLTNVDYSNNIPIMLYPNGHGSSFITLVRHSSTYSIEVSISAYVKKQWSSKDNDESCNNNEKSIATNSTFLEECIEESRFQILRENNAEEAWLGFAESRFPKNIYFLDENGTVIENSTITRRHELDYWFNGKDKLEIMRNKTQEIFNSCSDKLAKNACEVRVYRFSSC